MLDVVVAVTIVVCLLALAILMREVRFAGNAYAVDGDTIVMGSRRIRLRGLDAPELRQTCQRGVVAYRCGEEARAALRALIADRNVACAVRGRDRFQRDLATCEAGGADLGLTLVKRGLAVAYGAYADEEREAREARRGIWAGPFEPPQAWRRRHADGERSQHRPLAGPDASNPLASDRDAPAIVGDETGED